MVIVLNLSVFFLQYLTQGNCEPLDQLTRQKDALLCGPDMSFISKLQGRRNRRDLGAFGPWSGPHQILVISEIEKENKHSLLRKKFDCLELFLGLTSKSIFQRTSCELHTRKFQLSFFV